MSTYSAKIQKCICLIVTVLMILSTCGGAAYAEGEGVPPTLPEDMSAPGTVPAPVPEDVSGGEGVPETTVPEEPGEGVPAPEEPAATVTEGPVTDVPAAGEPVAPAAEEALAVPPMEETVPEAETPAETMEPVGQPEGSDDPLAERYNGIMTIAAAPPASFDAVRPRALQAGETLRKGVDVSAYQANIDWNAVAAGGMEFAIVRVGYRGVVEGKLAADACYVQNLTGAKAAGLKVGAYIYSQAITTEEAREEARYIVDLVRNYSIDLPLVFDYEEVSNTNRRLVMSKLDRQLKTDICNAFCQEVEAAGYQSMVYANPTMLNKDIYQESIKRLWLAHWNEETTVSGAYEYWQFGLGMVSGIPTKVDLDYWFDPGTAAAVPPADGQASTPQFDTPPDTAAPFTDVSQSDWFYDNVQWAYGKGIVDGMGDGSFGPGKTATRGQMTTMLYRMMGKPAVTGTALFTDLKADYYKDAINWAAANKVVNGTSATTFTPNGQITREDLVTMLYRMAGSPAVSGSLGSFKDASAVKSYARNAMIWAVDKGLIQGYANNTIQPGTAASRAEVCTLLKRYSGLA